MIKKQHYIVLSFFLTRVLFLGGGYSLFIRIGRNSSILCGFLGMLLGYFLLYLLYKKGKIHPFVCVLISIGVLFTNILSNTILTDTYLLYKTPTLVIMVVFFLVLLWASKKEFKILLRVSLASILIAIPILILVYTGLFPIASIENLKPLFDTSNLSFLQGILFFAVTSLLPNILLLNYKEKLPFKVVGLGYILGCLTDIYLLFLILSIYGASFASIIRFPEYLILKKFSVLDYVSNVENILIMVWIFNLLLSGWLCMKVIRESTSKKVFYGFLFLFFLWIEFFFNRHYTHILFIKNYSYWIWSFLILLSFLCKKNKNQKED